MTNYNENENNNRKIDQTDSTQIDPDADIDAYTKIKKCL